MIFQASDEMPSCKAPRCGAFFFAVQPSPHFLNAGHNALAQ
jgi:hypothetical protein